MNAPKFTPGPWQRCIGKGAIEIRGSFFGMQSSPRVCRVLHADPLSEENGCLIAAAPELYEALAELLRVDDEWHGAVNSEMSVARSKARAALARALGETP